MIKIHENSLQCCTHDMVNREVIKLFILGKDLLKKKIYV